MSVPSTYRAAQAAAAGGPFEIVERAVPQPGPGHVRISVDACGVCHSDAFFVDGALSGVRFPVVPGHEIAGRIEVLGEGTQSAWQVGDRVAVGWFGGSCGHCTPCRQGDFMVCLNLKVPGWAYDGGYAESVVVPADALARIPDALSAVDAAPMGCAGVTTFNGLRRSSARPGDLVAVLGIGGLGHLGVQYAAAMGFETVAIARGPPRPTSRRSSAPTTTSTAPRAPASRTRSRPWAGPGSYWPPPPTPRPSRRPWTGSRRAASWWSSGRTRSRWGSARTSC